MLEDIFGIEAEKELLDKALTHPSYTKENNLESLNNYENRDALKAEIESISILNNKDFVIVNLTDDEVAEKDEFAEEI